MFYQRKQCWLYCGSVICYTQDEQPVAFLIRIEGVITQNDVADQTIADSWRTSDFAIASKLRLEDPLTFRKTLDFGFSS